MPFHESENTRGGLLTADLSAFQLLIWFHARCYNLLDLCEVAWDTLLPLPIAYPSRSGFGLSSDSSSSSRRGDGGSGGGSSRIMNVDFYS